MATIRGITSGLSIRLIGLLLTQLVPTGTTGFELTIVHTNDVRARFEPISARRGGECTADLEAEGACFGGLARRVAAVKEIRESTENVLLLCKREAQLASVNCCINTDSTP